MSTRLRRDIRTLNRGERKRNVELGRGEEMSNKKLHYHEDSTVARVLEDKWMPDMSSSLQKLVQDNKSLVDDYKAVVVRNKKLIEKNQTLEGRTRILELLIIGQQD